MITKKLVSVLIGILMIINIGSSAAANSTSSDVNNIDINQIGKSAVNFKHYLEANYAIPNNVNVGNKTVSTSQYLYLLTAATTNINRSKNSSITVKNVSNPTSPSEKLKSGKFTKAEYLSYANNINAYINANGKLPNYITTSMGTMDCKTAIYIYTKIMNYYQINKVLPNTVSVESWSNYTNGKYGPPAVLNGTEHFNIKLLGNNSYGKVLKLTSFGTGTNDVAFIIGVHPQEQQAHVAMLNAIEALSKDLNNIKITVYDVIVYNGSNRNVGRTNGQDLAKAFVVPDINSSYKLVIDCHGNVGNYYVNGTRITNSIYAPSVGDPNSPIYEQSKSIEYNNKILGCDGALEHYVIVGGTSPLYVTLPIAAKGVPVLVYEQYLNQANYAKVLYIHAEKFVKAVNSAFNST